MPQRRACQPVSKACRNLEPSYCRAAKFELYYRTEKVILPLNADFYPRHKKIPAKYAKNPHYSDPQSRAANANVQYSAHADPDPAPHRTGLPIRLKKHLIFAIRIF